MSFNINHEINKFMTAYSEGDFGNPKWSQVLNEMTPFNRIMLFSSLSQNATTAPMDESKHKNFKMEYYGPLFEFIVDNINKIYFDSNTSNTDKCEADAFLNSILLDKLTKLFKGQHLLNKLNHRISQIVKNEESLLISSSSSGTFVTFLFWLNKTKGKTLENIKPNILEQIYINSIGNSDDRLFKFVLDHIDKHDKLFFQKNSTVIYSLIKVLSGSQVPPKFQLKRIKILSQHISLVPYFKHMIESFSSEKVILELHKHYYVQPHDYESLSNMVRSLVDYTENGMGLMHQKVEYLINILKTNEEKILCQIIISLLTYNNYNFVVSDEKTMEKVIEDNYIQIMHQIDWDNLIQTLDFMSYNKKILNILVNQNLVTRYLQNKNNNVHNYKMLFFTRFLGVNNHPLKNSLVRTIINVNLLLHKLRLIAKKRSKSKLIERKVKMFDLLNEIKNFKPNKTIPVLSNGSVFFQQQKQKFTNLPPRHLLPGELAIYQKFLLKEKADGILINNLPVGIYPPNTILNNYQVKAEYIEELDLYLIFDIDIPNTTIIDRYNMLRRAHTCTQHSYLEDISNLDDMFKIMTQEREQIKKFMRENTNQPTKWYPKFACKFEFDKSKTLYRQLISNVIQEEDTEINTKLKSSEPFNCDGLILTPLNGDREIKIKPKSMMTIDLMFDGKRWVDRNSNDWSHKIVKPKTTKKEGRIYRCYPDEDFTGKFVVGEYRYDKKHPNPFNVVDSIINMLNHKWDKDLNEMESYYYEENKSLSSIKLIQTIKAQNELLESRIEIMEPSFNKNWLDLGCGRGKLVSIIKKYNPKSYLGLDADIKQLVRGLKFHDENQNIYQFNPCDLSKDWNETNSKWFSFNNKIKYDYVVANFSLMHFCTDEFWTQLNEIVHEETKFMFNLVKPNQDNMNSEWKESNSFLKIEDSVVRYKFEWTHKDPKVEPLISNQQIVEYLTKFNWKVIDAKPVTSSHSLLNFYGWWIVQKC
jgi:hypothetical protein